MKLTSIGSAVNLIRRPPSPVCVTSTKTGPSRSIETLLLPFETPSGFFFLRLGCESAGRRRTWNIIEPIVSIEKKTHENFTREKYNRIVGIASQFS